MQNTNLTDNHTKNGIFGIQLGTSNKQTQQR